MSHKLRDQHMTSLVPKLLPKHDEGATEHVASTAPDRHHSQTRAFGQQLAAQMLV